MRSKGLTGFIAACAVAAAAPAVAAEQELRGFYVFGDSLNDTKNVFIQTQGQFPALPNYFFGRFSNGLVWPEYLAAAIHLPAPLPELRFNGLVRRGLNYARGGSGTYESNLLPSPDTPPEGVLGLTGQIAKFLDDAAGSAPSNALYTIWAGANDYSLAGQVEGLPFPPDPLQTTTNIVSSVAALHAAGARRFVVFDLPDISRVPLTPPDVADLVQGVVRVHNELLRLGLLQLLQDAPGVELTFVDTWALVNTLLDQPSTLGFGNEGAGPASGCLIPLPDGPPVFVCETRVPFDYVGSILMDEQHPTTLVHELIADVVERKLGATPARPAGVVLLDPVDPETTRSFRVAVLSNPGFDASRIDPSSVSFGPGRASPIGRMRTRDVNADGLDDALLRFQVRKLMPDCLLPALAMNGADVSANGFLAAMPSAPLCADAEA